MASDPNATPSPAPTPAPEPAPTPAPAPKAAARHRDKGVRVFSYPKIVFLLPTLCVAVICWIGMVWVEHTATSPFKPDPASAAKANATVAAPAVPATHDRFKTEENILAVLFLGVFAFNLLMMGLDFPRFTIVAIIFLVLFAIFFVLWIGAYFGFPLMTWVRGLMRSIYAVANAEFYFLIVLMMGTILGIVYITRWLDYWEILPNELLHHHGPLSDLERYPTTNLKFDKEVPDVLEHLLLGAGRLVLHVAGEKKAIVLDNVLFINAIENSLKGIMSRMEVRVTTDKEVDEL